MKSDQKLDLKKFLSYYKPYKALFTADIFAALLVAALAIVLPLCVQHITKNILASDTLDIVSEILKIGMLMVIVISLQTVFQLFYDYKGHVMGAKIERDMRRELFEHYQKLPLSFFDNQLTGQLMSRITNDILNLAELYHHGPENIAVYGTQFIGALIVLLHVNWKLAMVTFAILPLMAAYSFIFYKRLQKAYLENRRHIGDINARVQENLSGMHVVKSFSNENIEIERFALENQRFFESRADIYKNEAFHYSVTEKFFTQLITIAIVVAGGIWISGGTLSTPDLLIFIMYAAYLTAPVPKLAFMVEQYQDGLSGFKRFCEIIDIQPDIHDAKNASELKVSKGQVEFKNITFRYSDDQEYVLSDINLKVSAGETIAIVGRSGIGKTTLCSLIPRFYEASSGDILIDGSNIRDVTLSSLRQQIGIVSQDTFLFSGTILDNIIYGKPGATMAEAIVAAKNANAHDFIMNLPNGYDTNVGQRGVKLSGGQRQRITIARVFLKNPKILILDEATSSLDYESEKAVISSLRTLANGRTAFIIAHRLSTIRKADRIVVLTNEGIAEQGTHDELYSKNGEYSKLYNAQED